MTTIAYKDGILAADTLTTCGNHRDGYAPKAHKVGGVLIACSGTSTYCQAFVEWVRGGREGKSPLVGLADADACNAVVIGPESDVEVWCSAGSWRTTPGDGIYALGSGQEYAYGAMAMGASAIEAVKIAMRFDVKTGGDVTAVSLA
jgi:ATP-dependent HslUV protease subunit HslV